MTSKTYENAVREELERAIRAFADVGGSLQERAKALFGALGYASTRTAVAGRVEEFLEREGMRSSLSEVRRNLLLESWRAVEIVCQVTEEEIAGEATGPGASGFEQGRAQSFLFLAVDLKKTECRRKDLADMSRAVNLGFRMPVITLFRHGSALTLSVVHRRASMRDSDRDVLEKVTLVKDIQTGQPPHRAHIDILQELELRRMTDAGAQNFDDLHAGWEMALAVEKLNRRFYRDLFEWFTRAVGKCRFPDDQAGPGSVERHVIRLITRLLFIWFLKEKGLVPEDLFTKECAQGALKSHTLEGTDYYRAVLQNLFFATLNTEICQRGFGDGADGAPESNKYRYRDLLDDPDAFLKKLRSVPFVNGGLFDCLDDAAGNGPAKRLVDAFSDGIENEGQGLCVPACLFFGKHGLFDLLGRYKFTVEENTPLDQEVALDPELLGLVFENLLAAYNPETRDTVRKATVRKATGSYYTPRHVVDYMVDEALAAALAGKIGPTNSGGTERDRLRRLLDHESAFEDGQDTFPPEEEKDVVRAIAELRVLDPAVGSGAFPMGVLRKLTLALRRLDPGNAHWEELQKERAQKMAGDAFGIENRKARDAALMEVSRTFEAYRDSDFGRKLYLMQNSIFGVDIQPIACQIAKLRFFISLIVEQTPNDDLNKNYGIRPLPNLETRIVAANALIGARDHEGEPLREGELLRDHARAIERGLQGVRESYFNARTPLEKRRLRNLDNALRKDLAQELEGTWVIHDIVKSVVQWNPYDQSSGADWFDPGWMFGVSDGFDVVIGNPPYISRKKIPALDKDSLRREFEDFYRGNADVYTYFFQKGVRFLRSNGLLCFIASNKFMRAEYGQPLRAFLKKEAPPVLLLDLARTGAFDATVRPLIMLARKGGTHDTLRAGISRSGGGQKSLGAFMKENGFGMRVSDLSDDGWVLAKPALLRLLGRIRTVGKPLRDYLSEGLLYGILTGRNEALVIDSDTRSRLIEEDPSSARLIRPWLRGKDARRWRGNHSGRHVIAIASSANASWPWSEEKTEADAVKVFNRSYPAVCRHLSTFEDKLRKRQARGKFFWELRACTYYRAFYQPKIVYPKIAEKMRAFIDLKNFLTNDKCFIIPGKETYLLSLLNSRLLDFYFRMQAPCLDDPFSGGHMEFHAFFMETIPIAPAEQGIEKRLSRIANEIQSAKEADPNVDVARLERQIDEIVYSLYGLDRKDVALIEDAVSNQ